MQHQGKCIGIPGIAGESQQERARRGRRLPCRQAHQNDALAVLRRQFDMAGPNAARPAGKISQD
ncbi:MAG: hypothetical protein E5W85_19985 [Mesorhizobium sp.]|nr:MAG: hypothetical protein E5W85_19985 [Mesorhizobium sp.]